MATDVQLPTSSSNLRSQIGLARARLERALAPASTLPEPSENGEALTDDHSEMRLLHKAIRTPFSRLQSLHQSWLELMSRVPAEKEVYADFVERTGDYTSLMAKAVSMLEEIDKRMEQLETTAESLNVTILKSPSPATEECFQSGDVSVKSVFCNVAQRIPMANSSVTARPAPDFGAPPGLPLPMTQPGMAPPGLNGSFSTAPVPQPWATSHPPPAPVVAPHGYPVSFPTAPATLGALDSALLTRLDVPVFSGNLLEFPEFWTRFSSLVHSKSTLDNGSKFSLLKSCLQGPALQCLAGLPVTSENYPLAVSLLHSTYNDESTTRHLLLSRLLNLPPCDERTLAQRFAQMNSLVRQFDSVNHGSPEHALATALINKLPRSIRGKVLDKTPPNSNLTPTQLMEILGQIVRKEFMLDSMAPVKETPPEMEMVFNATNPKKRNKDKDHWKNRHGPQRGCSFCGKSHFSHLCSTHSTPAQRIQAVKRLNLCFNCLSTDHSCSECPSRRNCRSCGDRHHSSLCKKESTAVEKTHGRTPAPAPPQVKPSTPAPSARNTGSKPRRPPHSTHFADLIPDSIPVEHPPEVTFAALDSSDGDQEDGQEVDAPVSRNVALMCLPVTIVNPDKPTLQIQTMAFFDSGSTRTYVSQELAASLDLDSLHDEEVVINVFGNQKTTMQSQHHRVCLLLSDDSSYPLNVRSLPNLAHEIPCAVVESSISTSDENNHLVDVRLTRTSPGILIGSDHFWDLILWDQFYSRHLAEGLRLLNTRLGVIAAGPTITMESIYYAANSLSPNPLCKDNLDSLVERFWKMETTGTTDVNTTTKDDDAQCLEHFQSHIRFESSEDRYYVKWPFRTSTEDLPTNWKMAYSRLWSTWKQLSKNKENMKKYSAILEEQLAKEIIEVAPSEGVQGGIHYLAHHAVVTENKKTTKVRMVFDASAKEKGKMSLNDSLYRGPVLLPDICGILLRCRLCPLLMSADIEKAFLMVGLEEPDRDYTRFLWLKDPALPPSEDNLVVFRFRRVPFGVISSPFMLAGTIHHHLSNASSDLARSLLQNLYVDNAFIAASSVEEGQSIYFKAKELFKTGGMNLREWISNDKDLNRFFKEKEGSIDSASKILGLSWNTDQDSLRVSLQQPTSDSSSWTKRSVLKFIASTYDPLGLLAPVLLPYKVFLQTLWKDEQHWDDVLSKGQLNQWMDLLQENATSSSFIEVNRRLSLPTQNLDEVDIGLHVFSDACDHGYAACAYLRVSTLSTPSSTSIYLLMAKSRLPPAKKAFTIPRLELMGIEMGSSLAKYLLKELDLPISSVTLWTDSSPALSWCQSQKHLPIFVNNRVNKIKENVPTAHIRHVRSQNNPADVASRGCTLSELQQDNLWWTGPDFLYQPENEWPTLEGVPHLESEKLAIDELPVDVPQATVYVSDAQENSAPSLIDVDRFGSWEKLLNTMVFVLLFLRLRLGQQFKKLRIDVPDDQRKATLYLFRLAQLQDPPSEAVIKQLNLRLGYEGLWLMHTRVDPLHSLIYLPPSNRITMLYILHVHRNLLHSGYSCTLNQLRRTVWIPKGRSVVKSVLRKECFACRRKAAKPFALPPFPPLPESRTHRPPYPFFNTGMDYLGPFRTSEERQVHICLFTCMSTRLIHVEIATDLSAHTFVNLLRRFIALQGCPRTLISDNALHFTTASSAYLALLLRDSSRFPEFDALCKHHRMEFKFIPAFSPWSGGFYERMVGIFKKALGHALGRSVPTIDDLRTFAAEAAAVVNCRPLTYVSSDPDAQDITALRPLDFARPFANTAAPLFEVDTNNDDEWRLQETKQTELIDFWTRTTSRLDRFWDRWSSEYLAELKERYQRTHGQGHHLSRRTPIEGEVVMIHQEHISRGLWRLGRIVRLNGDVIRSAEIRLASGKTITRPVNLLYPLEILPSQTTTTPAAAPTILKETSTVKAEPSKNVHPMVTRNKARLNLLYFAAILLSLCAQPAGAARCPPSTPHRQVLYADSCSSSSAAVIRYKGHTGFSLCWDLVNCTVGHIRFSTTQAANTGLCGERCTCPQTMICSQYQGVRTKESIRRFLPDDVLHYRPPFVCSFTASSLCSDQPLMTTVPVIILHDNTTVIVKELHVQQPQFDPEDTPVCFDSSGKTVTFSSSLKSTGTSGFCSAYSCTPSSDVLCTIRRPSAFFTYQNGSIPVAAWGYMLRSYYPDRNDSTPLPSVSVVASCAKGGLELFNVEDHFVEACIGQTCIHQNDYSSGSTIFFPTALVLFDYTVNVIAWKNGSLTYSDSTNCPAHPLCETISCLFCQEHLWNYKCWNLQDALLFITFWIASTMIYMVLSPIWILLRVLGFILHPFSWIMRRLKLFLCCRRERATVTIPPIPTYNRRRNRLTTRAPLIGLLSIVILPGVLGCADTTTVMAQSRNCIISGDTEKCDVVATATLSVQPLAQEVCLVMRDKEDHPAALLKLQIYSVVHSCNKRILFFTRDHRFYTESSHRCHMAGSCKDDKCKNLKTTDSIEELSHEANGSPGFSYCSSSCGCVTCHGCFLCSPSCLFYRVYASPASSTIYSIFDCPTWTTTVSGKATLEKEGASSSSTTFSLDPARPFRWNNLVLTLTSHSLPPLPVLSSTFISNGATISSLPQRISDFGLNSPGQLKCLTAEDARTFNCKFPSEACSCLTTSDSAKCHCSDGDATKYISKNPLPIYSQQVTLLAQGTEGIQARLSQGSAVQVLVATSGFSWSTTISRNTCQMKVLSPLSGCYSCLPGGRLSVSCISEPSNEVGDVICGEARTTVLCTPEGKPQNLHLHFETSSIDVSCTLSCKNNKDSFGIKGELNFVADPILTDNLAAPAQRHAHFSDLLETVDAAIGRFAWSLLKPILIIGTIVVVLFVLVIIYKNHIPRQHLTPIGKADKTL